MDMGWTNHSAFDWFVYFGQSILFFNSFLPLFSILPFHLLPSLKPRHFFHYPPPPPQKISFFRCVFGTEVIKHKCSWIPFHIVPTKLFLFLSIYACIIYRRINLLVFVTTTTFQSLYPSAFFRCSSIQAILQGISNWTLYSIYAGRLLLSRFQYIGISHLV